jgi:hypothetical protein
MVNCEILLSALCLHSTTNGVTNPQQLMGRYQQFEAVFSLKWLEVNGFGVLKNVSKNIRAGPQ